MMRETLLVVTLAGCGSSQGSDTTSPPPPAADGRRAQAPEPTADVPPPAEEAPAASIWGGEPAAPPEENRLDGGDYGGADSGLGRSDLGSVKLGSVESTGGLDGKQVEKFVRRVLPRARYCYEKSLIKAPDLTGTLKLAIKIDEAGDVSHAETKSGTGDAALDACVTDAIKKQAFPRPRNGAATARLSMSFKPNK